MEKCFYSYMELGTYIRERCPTAFFLSVIYADIEV